MAPVTRYARSGEASIVSGKLVQASLKEIG